MLSSKVHILWLFVLLLYTNVTSALGACIAAGGTMTLVHHARRESRLAAERHRLTAEVHQLLRLAHPEHAAALDASRAAGGAEQP